MAMMIKALITKVEMLKESICRIDFQSKELAEEALPGQFVNIRCGDGVSPVLRRPISICDVDRKSNTLTVAFQIKATGTKMLAKLLVGDRLDLIGPLGKGFDLDARYTRILVVGGGIGIFPLLFLLKQSSARFKAAFLGFRNSNLVVMEDDFKSLVSEPDHPDDTFRLFTDDGSYGERGLVVNGLTQYIGENKIDIVYSCGPTMMLKNVAKAVQEAGALCQLSIEQRMGCGIGACLVCACKVKALTGGFVYKHVCKDGPVFWANDLIFEE